ncbi:MAG: alpha/beta hydrolase [Nocardioides sp.]|uniref:alpha/beta hydrolase n=1 Tax=Nocardioides sp. TaxID=35761 RepID=UPI003F117B48
MPSAGHEFIARVVPRLRKARDLDDEARERARVERWHAGLDRTLPTRLVPGLARRFDVVTQDAGGFPTYVLTPRDVAVRRTVHYLHGGGYMAPIDPFHVRYVTRLATALGARVVLPDYPLAPEYTWRDSHDALVAQTDRWAREPGGVVLAGDSAGGGLALAVAQSVRDRGLAAPTHLVMHAPWVDLTTSTPETADFARRDPWLFFSKLDAYAGWWAGSDEDLARPEVSPALGDLSGLPPALVLYGTRDLLAPGCRLLRRRAAEAGWALTGVEEPDLLHVYGLFPFIPEARRAMRQVVEFVG